MHDCPSAEIKKSYVCEMASGCCISAVTIYVLNACEVTSSSCHPIGVPQTKAHASYQSVIIQTQRNTNELRAQRVRGPKSSAQKIAQVCKVLHLTGCCNRNLNLTFASQFLTSKMFAIAKRDHCHEEGSVFPNALHSDTLPFRTLTLHLYVA